MGSKIARYSFTFILIHWVLALTTLVLLGLGWYIQYIPVTTPSRSFLLDLHMSLGLTSALLISILIFLRIIFKPPSFPNDFPQWQKLSAYALYAFIYTSFSLMIVSGYFQAVFSKTPVQFWGIPLPVWGVADATLAQFFGTIHGIAAYILVALIFLHVGIVVLNIFIHHGFTSRMLPFGMQKSRELVLGETKSVIASKMAQRLAKDLRLFGWIEFWIQFVFAFLSALLLAFATSGRAFSPGSVGFSDGIYWGGWGFLLLCFTALLAFYYTRAAKKIILRPDSYFTRKLRTAFWFLRMGILIGFLGVFISFTGVGLSLSLLIAKTVSQPPGIAITDPNKIIRALDVFVLLVNFILLMAHFIGTSITLWLSIDAAKVRLEYLAIPGQSH